jgi:pimeloyl-ACP methyl ester carboxylesterase
MSLPDGRILGFAEYGHPKGYPLIYFHGYPSCRIEASVIDDLCQRRYIKLLAPERPGFGLSTYQRNRKITDWPNDIKAFAEHQRLKKFALLGGSAGGPYALACAKALPSEMVTGVGLLGSAGPWDKPVIQHIPWVRYLIGMAATYTPMLLRIAASVLASTLRWVEERPAMRKLRIEKYERLNRQDKAEEEKRRKEEARKGVKYPKGYKPPKPKTAEERRQRKMDIMFEPYAQGTAGAVQEAALMSGDWGIKFEEVRHPKVLIWHGTKDFNAPLAMVKYMADGIPGSTLKVYEGEGHSGLTSRIEEIVGELVTEKMVDRWKKGSKWAV